MDIAVEVTGPTKPSVDSVDFVIIILDVAGHEAGQTATLGRCIQCSFAIWQVSKLDDGQLNIYADNKLD